MVHATPSTLPELVTVLVHLATTGGAARVRTSGLSPVELAAFHAFRLTWPPTRGMRWRVRHLEN